MAIKKKTAGKTPKKKAAVPKKAAAKEKKKVGSRKTAAKARAGRTEIPQSRTTAMAPLVEPGPPPGSIPPVEEPIPQEIAVGVVTHYYGHLGVAVVQINQGSLRTGATIRVKGHTTDFTQQIASMEQEHHHVEEALPGDSVGIKIVDHARQHDIVFLVK
jgi:hypothetical protein